MNPTQLKNAEPTGSARIGLGTVEFIFTIALMTASIAIAIDSMLPALPKIGQSLHLADPNDAQLVIGVYFLGFGLSQLLFGSLSDTFGRRPILLGGLAFYMITMLAAGWSTSFTMLLILRFAQGFGAAAVRITSMAIVRDCFGGREMARVMSFVMIVFMVSPILAPTIGQLVSNYAGWEWIFILLGTVGGILFIWAFVRMRESLPPEDKMPFSVRSVASGFKTVLTNRITCGYMLGMTLYTGVICAYVVSVQQVFGEVYGLGEWMPTAFAATAGGIAVAQFANGFLVRGFGMRRMSHAAMIVFTVLGIVGYLIALNGTPAFAVVYVLITIMLMAFAIVTTNFMAISLEPMGHLAGTATAITGFVSTTGGALLGSVVGRMFDGTILPLFGGFAIFGALTVLFTLWAEGGKLFTHPGDDPQLEAGAGHI
jgi:DHA1 family bicyclomycin/chloramphenicol resistance-like MFS transporter